MLTKYYIRKVEEGEPMKTRLTVYAGDSTYYPVCHEAIYASRKAAEKVAQTYAGCAVTFEEYLEKLVPTKKIIHKALW